MNKVFKKSAIGLAILSLAGMAQAFTFDGFFGGIEGSYLQPRNDDLTYVTIPPLITNPNASYSSVSVHTNNHEWSYRLFGGMNFCGGEDVTFSYLRFHAPFSSFVEDQPADPAGTEFTRVTTPRWLFASSWSHTRAHVSFNLDDYYMTFGHTVTVNAWNMRFAGGLEYARFDSDMTVQSNLITGGPSLLPSLGYTAKNEVRAFGPRLEFDVSYNLPFGMSVFADTNAALFMSRRIISLNTLDAVGVGGLFFPTFNFTTRYPIIPKVGLRLGAGFSQTFGPVGGEGAAKVGTTMSAQVGWQVESYIHAIERPGENSFGGSGFKSRMLVPDINDDTTKVSNYDYQGPFVALQLATNWL
jgi:hypothetical protein